MHIKRFAYIAMCGYIAQPASAVSADTPPSYAECTPTKLNSCGSDKENCESIPIVTVDGAYLLKIHLNKKYSETFAGTEKVSQAKIDRIDNHSDLLFLYGYQDEYHGKPLPHSWTAVLDPQTGRLTVSSVANGMGYILNGDCNIAGEGKPQ